MKIPFNELQGEAKQFILESFGSLSDDRIYEVVKPGEPLDIKFSINGVEFDYVAVTNNLIKLILDNHDAFIAEKAVEHFDDLIKDADKIKNLLTNLRREVKDIAEQKMNVRLNEDY